MSAICLLKGPAWSLSSRTLRECTLREDRTRPSSPRDLPTWSATIFSSASWEGASTNTGFFAQPPIASRADILGLTDQEAVTYLGFYAQPAPPNNPQNALLDYFMFG